MVDGGLESVDGARATGVLVLGLDLKGFFVLEGEGKNGVWLVAEVAEMAETGSPCDEDCTDAWEGLGWWRVNGLSCSAMLRVGETGDGPCELLRLW